METFIPPHNLDAEKSALASMLLSAEAIDVVLGKISADDFYADAHQRIYRAIVGMHEQGKKIDPVTLAYALNADEQLEEIGGIAYINELMERLPHAYHADHYALIVEEESLRRQASLCGRALCILSVDRTLKADEVVAESEKKIHALMERRMNGEQAIAISDVLMQAFDRIGHAKRRGISSGFSALDAMTFGWQPGQLTILAARPSVGKTALACNFALAASRAGQGVMYFALEQGRLGLAERLLSLESGIDGNKIKSGVVSDDERYRLMEAANRLSQYSLLIDDTANITVSRIAAKARLVQRRYGLGLLIIDYLQLVRPDDARTVREQQVASMSRGCAVLSRELDIPVMVLCQFNRAFETRSDKSPRLSDLRESGSLEQDGRVILLMDRPYTYDPVKAMPWQTILHLAKNSEGSTGKIELEFHASRQLFEQVGIGVYSENPFSD